MSNITIEKQIKWLEEQVAALTPTGTGATDVPESILNLLKKLKDTKTSSTGYLPGKEEDQTLHTFEIDWRDFTENDYETYKRKLRQVELYSGDYLGSIRVGDILIDLSVYSDQQSTEIALDDDARLRLKFYVGGVDTGYGYGQFGYPYNCIQSAEYDFDDAMDGYYDYEEFRMDVHFKVIEIISKAADAYHAADLIEKAEEKLHVWTTDNASHLR